MVSERRDSHATAVTVAEKSSQSMAHPVMPIVKSLGPIATQSSRLIPQRKSINPIATQSSQSIPQRIPSLEQLTSVADSQRKEGLLSQKQMEESTDSATAVVSLHLKYVQRAMALKHVDSIEREFLDQTPSSTLRRVPEKRIPLIGDWLVEIQVVSQNLGQLTIRQVSAARQREEELRIKQRQAEEQSRIALISDFENRKFLLISDFQVSSLTPFLESHQTFSAQIAGFFIVEDRVLRIGGGLISKVVVENLWGIALSRMCSILEDQFSRMQTANHLLLIKDYISEDLTAAIRCAVVSIGVGLATEVWPKGTYDGLGIILNIILVVFVTAISDYWQSLQFRDLDKEKKKISVQVTRDGYRQKVSIYDLVVGDVVHLNIGDLVPADGVFISGYSLLIDQSSLSGESVPVNISEKRHFLLSGTKVQDGLATMLVTTVGMRTEWGKLMETLSESGEDETPLRVKLNGVATIIGKIGLGFAVLTFLFAWSVSLLGVTLRRYGYPIDALLDVLSKHRDKYHELQLSDCHKQISEALAADKLEQTNMNKEYEYLMNVLCFQLQTSNIVPAFPFLAPFPSIEDFVSFMSYGGQLDFYNMMAANMALFERACDFFFRHAAQLSGIPLRMVERGMRQFPLTKANDKAEEMLFGLLKQKVDGFLMLIEMVNWMADDPPQEGNEYANEVIIFLETLVSTAKQILPVPILKRVMQDVLAHTLEMAVGALLASSQAVKVVQVTSLMQNQRPCREHERYYSS